VDGWDLFVQRTTGWLLAVREACPRFCPNPFHSVGKVGDITGWGAGG